MINKEDFDCAFKILELQTNILNLKLQQVKLGYYRRSTTLKVLDSKLLTLLKSITKYNFIPRINLGNSLLVGEGNLSFSVSLMKNCNNYLDVLLLHMKIMMIYQKPLN